jgi:hypothetical protein
MKILIEHLCPGERDIFESKVQAYRRKLDRGETLEPIKVVEIKGRKHVRDGAHRVRARIDYCEANNLPPEIEYVDGSEPPINEFYPAICKKIVDEFGCGLEGFKSIPFTKITGQKI